MGGEDDPFRHMEPIDTDVQSGGKEDTNKVTHRETVEESRSIPKQIGLDLNLLPEELSIVQHPTLTKPPPVLPSPG